MASNGKKAPQKRDRRLWETNKHLALLGPFGSQAIDIFTDPESDKASPYVGSQIILLRNLIKSQRVILSFLSHDMTSLHHLTLSPLKQLLQTLEYFLDASRNAYTKVQDYKSKDGIVKELISSWGKTLRIFEAVFQELKEQSPALASDLTAKQQKFQLRVSWCWQYTKLYLKVKTHFNYSLHETSGKDAASEPGNTLDMSEEAEVRKAWCHVRKKRSESVLNGLNSMIFIGRLGNGRIFVAGSAIKIDPILLPPNYKDMFGNRRYQHFLQFAEGITIWDATVECADKLTEEIGKNDTDWGHADGAVRAKQVGQAIALPAFKTCGPCAKCRRLHQYQGIEDGDGNADKRYDKGGNKCWEFFHPFACAEDHFALEFLLSEKGRSTRERSEEIL